MFKLRGKITISRANSNNAEYNNKVLITLEDADYRLLANVWINAEQLGLALTGLACQECEIEHI